MACTVSAPPACSGPTCKKDFLGLFKTVTLIGDFHVQGVGTRNTGSGTINFNNVPEGATISEAYLYWNTIVENSYVGDDMVTFSGPYGAFFEVGTLIGFCGPTCWQNETNHFNRIYRADVGPTGSGSFGGNGAYTISGLPFDPTGIIGPDGSRVPKCAGSQGALLLVIYEYNNAGSGPYPSSTRTRTINIYDGAVRVVSAGLNQTIYGGIDTQNLFVSTTKFGAPKIAFGIGDAQIWSDSIRINGQQIATAGPNVGFDLFAQTIKRPCNIRQENTITLFTDVDCLSWFLFVISGYEVPPPSLPRCQENTTSFKNCAVVRAVGDYNAGDTLIVVDSNDDMPSTTPFRIKIADEIIRVDSGPPNSTMWTVSRGQEGTIATGILSGSCVRQLLTRQGFLNLLRCRSATGLQTERCDQSGIFLPFSPGWYWYWWWYFFFYWYAWAYMWEAFAFWEAEGGWSWFNQGSATIDTSKGGSFIYSTANATTNVHFRAKSLASFPISDPYMYTAGFLPLLTDNNNVAAGIGVRESATGKFIYFSWGHDSTSFGKGDLALSIDKFNSPTSFNSNYMKINASEFPGRYAWLRILDDSTNLNFLFSSDGKNFDNLFSASRTDFLAGGPNQVLYGVNSNNGNVGMTTHSLDVKSAT